MSGSGQRRRRARTPHLLFVGPHLGRHPGWVVTQSEILADLFAGEGYAVSSTSSIRRPIPRTAQMLFDLTRWRRRVDVVVLSVFSGRAFHIADAVSAAARALGLPQVHVLRGGAFPELAASKPVWARRVLGRADAVVAPSPFLARTADELGLEALVIPNVLNLTAYPFSRRDRFSEPLDLLWLRTFHPIYRPQAAVETLAELDRRGLRARLTVAGQDKGLESECRVLAAELGLEDRVRFPGFLDAEGKRRELSSHDVYLHTNAVDNTPVTVLEAAAHGLPVVATAVGGLPDLIDPEHNGLLVADGSAAQHASGLADAVERLHRDPALAARLSDGGRALAERCAWTQVHGQWRELFERL
ncbi:MAG: glycosyltransferase family 4 protein [Acidobacteriota bacterium]